MGQTLCGAFWIYRAPLILSGCNHEREALFPIYTDEKYKAEKGLMACPEGLISHLIGNDLHF